MPIASPSGTARPELAQRCLINARAGAANNDPDFSVKIREELPNPLTMQELDSMP